MTAIALTNHNGLIPHNMDGLIRLAEMMARGKLVPAHLQSSPADCLMVIEQAARWGMSPFAVAQCTSVVQGKLMFEGKLVAAALHTSGALASRMVYIYEGDGAGRSVTVSAVLAGETDPRSVTVKLADAKTNNGIWIKQPDQQLAYHGVRVWARRFAPEVMLGVYSPEEMEPPPKVHRGMTIDEPATPSKAIEAPPKKPSVADWLDALEREMMEAKNTEAIDEILRRLDVHAAQDKLKNGARERLLEIIRMALDRFNASVEDVFPGDIP